MVGPNSRVQLRIPKCWVELEPSLKVEQLSGSIHGLSTTVYLTIHQSLNHMVIHWYYLFITTMDHGSNLSSMVQPHACHRETAGCRNHRTVTTERDLCAPPTR